jgi:Cysteine-rich secretory protein family/S-layer homology domain
VLLLQTVLIAAPTASAGQGWPTTLAMVGSAEQNLLALTNDARAAAGLPDLVWHPDLADDAEAQAQRMADSDQLYHTEDLAAVTTGWTRLGENVGFGASVSVVHDAFMASSDHRENLLGEWDSIGVGVVVDGSLVWVSVIFMESVASSGAFSDDDGSTHEEAINRLAAAGVTNGCGSGRYCPGEPVTRAEMASFLARALGLGDPGIDAFADDNGSVHEWAIDAVAEAGITLGCASGRYCPESVVSRAEMASFLARALGLGDPGTDVFNDDDGSPHEGAIDAIAGAGVTNGCGAGRYCPEQPVTRAEMASLLVRAFDL